MALGFGTASAMQGRWAVARLAALALLAAGPAGAEMPDRSMSLHITPATSGQNPCAPEVIGNLTCGDFVVEGNSTTDQWLHVVATGLVGSVHWVLFGLSWGDGFHVGEWRSCTDGVETPVPVPYWPLSTNGLMVEWEPPEPYSGPDQIAVIGALQVLQGSVGSVYVIGPPGYWGEVLIFDGGFPYLEEDDLGAVDVAGGGWGYNPCDTVATPTMQETWGRVKALYR